jgi:hypothetical protein
MPAVYPAAALGCFQVPIDIKLKKLEVLSKFNNVSFFQFRKPGSSENPTCESDCTKQTMHWSSSRQASW